MSTQIPYHVIYLPQDDRLGTAERIVEVVASADTQEMRRRVKQTPGAIVMLLEAVDLQEIPSELKALGFVY